MMKPAKNTICLWYDGDAEEGPTFTPGHSSIHRSGPYTARPETFLQES